MNTHHVGPSNEANTPDPFHLPAVAPEPPMQTATGTVTVFEDVLDRLQRAGHTWGDLIEWISDPSSSCPANNRYDGFFNSADQVSQVLNNWASRHNCKSGRKAMNNWAVEHVRQKILREGDEVTKSNILQSHTMAIDRSFISGFSLTGLYRKLSMLCPVTTSLLHSLATTPRQDGSKTEQTEQRKEHVSAYRQYVLVWQAHLPQYVMMPLASRNGYTHSPRRTKSAE